MTCYHKIGSVGIRFSVLVQARVGGILERVSLAGNEALWLDFLKPSGLHVRVRGTEDTDTGEIVWRSTPGFLDESGTWKLSATIDYIDGTVVRAAYGDLFEVREE